MSDHYCCKRCHQRYDECSCEAIISTISQEQLKQIKEDWLDLTRINQVTKTMKTIIPERSHSILRNTTDGVYYDAKQHLKKEYNMIIPCSFCGRHPCECAKAGWPGAVSPYPPNKEYTPILTKEQMAKILEDAKSETKDKIKTEAVKADSGKMDWSLLPVESVEEILKVLTFGATKYDDWNWSTGEGFKYTRVFNATMRHLWAWFKGEDNDPETGLSHWAHAGCNVLFMLHFIKNKHRYNQDDRKFFRAK